MIQLFNKYIKVNIDETKGCAVTYFSETQYSTNVLDISDLGRMIQASWYGNTTAGMWRGYPWPINPVQCGSSKNIASKIVDHRKLSDTVHVSTTQMVDWSTHMLVPCWVDQRVELVGPVFKLHHTIRYSGLTESPRHQELPAIFVGSRFDTIKTLSDSRKLGWNVTPPYGSYLDAPLGWGALMKPNGYGLAFRTHGQIQPIQLTCYRFLTNPSCSYAAPIVTLPLSKDMVFSYRTEFTLGSGKVLYSNLGV